MKNAIREEVKDDLLSRGYSRRQMMRAAMIFSGGATALTLNPEIAFAQEKSEAGAKVRIGQNECWTGPMAPGAKAAAAAIAVSNRYSPNDEHGQLVTRHRQDRECAGRSHHDLAGLQRSLGPFGGRLLFADQEPGASRPDL